MDKFLEKYNFPKLNQEEIENLNRRLTSTEGKTVIRNIPANKSPGPYGFTAEVYQKFRERLTPIARRNINNLSYADDTTFMTDSEEELKSLWMKVKVESEKVGLKLNIQKTKIMASGPITSWEIDGETVETMSDFLFWGTKITAVGDCSHEIKKKKHLLLGRKVLTNLDSIFKSRDIILPTKVRLIKAMVFPGSCMDVRVGL